MLIFGTLMHIIINMISLIHLFRFLKKKIIPCSFKKKKFNILIERPFPALSNECLKSLHGGAMHQDVGISG